MDTEMTEASTTPAALGKRKRADRMDSTPPMPAAFYLGVRKRSLEELGLPAQFVAGEDGAYNSTEMPKRFNFPEALDAEDARTTAVYVRSRILNAADLRAILASSKHAA